MSSDILINDAFYCIDTSLLVYRAVSLLLKKGVPEYIPSELFFVPNILELNAKKWKSVKEEARKTFFLRDSYTESELVDCPHLNLRELNIRMTAERDIYCSRLNVAGDRPPRGVIPGDMNLSAFFVERSFLDELTKRFVGLDVIKVDKNRLERVNKRTKEVLSSYELYNCLFSDYVSHDLIVDHLKRSPFCCDRCGKPRVYCPYCDAFSKDCPYCGQKWVGESPESLRAFRNLFVTEATTAKRRWIDPFGEVCVLEDCPPLRGENWCGADFFDACVSASFCTGRVVKWFVEENIGIVAFSPYQVDVSKCTPDQRERIESIRYTPEF
ncbi:MAG: hypothetical protein ACOX0A_08485 [Thermoguttaceae bacterium]|jgi:hypothetical protein